MKDEKWGVDPVWCNFRLFDANSLAANQQLSLLYEKLPCLSRIRHAHALHSSSLFFSLSLLLRHSLPFVPLHSRATDFSSFSFSHHHASFSLFTDYTFRSLVHELHASIFLSLSDKQARSPFFFFFNFRVAWSFVYPWTKKVCVNDTQILEYRSGSPTSMRCDHIFHVRCWLNDLAYT